MRQLFYCCETATPGRLRVGRYYQRGLWESILSDEILMGGTLWGSIMAQDGWNPLKSHAKAMQKLERNNNLKINSDEHPIYPMELLQNPTCDSKWMFFSARSALLSFFFITVFGPSV